MKKFGFLAIFARPIKYIRSIHLVLFQTQTTPRGQKYEDMDVKTTCFTIDMCIKITAGVLSI